MRFRHFVASRCNFAANSFSMGASRKQSMSIELPAHTNPAQLDIR